MTAIEVYNLWVLVIWIQNSSLKECRSKPICLECCLYQSALTSLFPCFQFVWCQEQLLYISPASDTWSRFWWI